MLDSLGTRALELADLLLAEPDTRAGGTMWAFSYLEAGGHWDRFDSMLGARTASDVGVRRAAVAAIGTALIGRQICPDRDDGWSR